MAQARPVRNLPRFSSANEGECSLLPRSVPCGKASLGRGPHCGRRVKRSLPRGPGTALRVSDPCLSHLTSEEHVLLTCCASTSSTWVLPLRPTTFSASSTVFGRNLSLRLQSEGAPSAVQEGCRLGLGSVDRPRRRLGPRAAPVSAAVRSLPFLLKLSGEGARTDVNTGLHFLTALVINGWTSELIKWNGRY